MVTADVFLLAPTSTTSTVASGVEVSVAISLPRCSVSVPRLPVRPSRSTTPRSSKCVTVCTLACRDGMSLLLDCSKDGSRHAHAGVYRFRSHLLYAIVPRMSSVYAYSSLMCTEREHAESRWQEASLSLLEKEYMIYPHFIL